MSIKIKKSPLIGKTVNDESYKEDLLIAIAMHSTDVQKGCAFIANKIIEAGINHDYTKIPTVDEYIEEQKSGIEHKAGKWYPAHINTERHHFHQLDKCPDDYNLIDVIEALVDCTMAAKARNGQTIKMNTDFISPELLAKAFKNTVEMIESEIVVENE
jgi:hypothetical protein